MAKDMVKDIVRDMANLDMGIPDWNDYYIGLIAWDVQAVEPEKEFDSAGTHSFRLPLRDGRWWTRVCASPYLCVTSSIEVLMVL